MIMMMMMGNSKNNHHKFTRLPSNNRTPSYVCVQLECQRYRKPVGDIATQFAAKPISSISTPQHNTRSSITLN